VKIAITGASGDIGTRLLARLHDARVPCCGLVRHTTPRLARRPELDVRRVDLTDIVSLTNALAGCQVVIHTALDQTPETTEKMVANNLRLLPSLIQCCRKLGIRRFIHLSSIVAIPPRITPEVIALSKNYSKETDWYSRTKVASEKWLQAQAADLDLCLIRAGLVYGPYMNWTRHAFAKLQSGRISLPAEHDAPCYAIHVDDICDLLKAAAQSTGQLPRLIYGINPEAVTWTDFFGGLAAVAGLPEPNLEKHPLKDFQTHLNSPITLKQSLHNLVQWLWRCPLIPASVRSLRSLQKISRIARKMSLGEKNQKFSTDRSANRPLVWPNRFELETYLSTASFTPAQTGAPLGFICQKPLAVGLQDSVAWWQGNLAAILAHS
jgi:nucleoside-diphosphate-sugar epimerase